MNIVTFSSLKTNPIRKTTSNTSYKVGVCLSDAPSSSVTVTFASTLGKFTASASMTFTTANWSTPQTLTLTAVSDGVTDVVVMDTLTISAANGGYDGVTKVLTLPVYDSVAWPYDLMFGYDYWVDNVHVVNTETKRLEALAFIMNNNGLPSGYSSLTSASYTGGMHGGVNTSNVTGLVTCDRYTITWNDIDSFVWTHRTFLITQSGSHTKLLILVHSNDSYNDELAIEAGLAAGMDVLYTGVPVNGTNTETNPTVTGTFSTGWNQMVSGGLDRVGYSPMELFFFDICISLNYIDDNYSYEVYGISGIHAGGFVALVYGALDPRIDKSFPMRGLQPLPFDNVAGPYPLGDNLAVNGAKTYNFFRDNVSMADYMIICAKQKFLKMLVNTRDATSSSESIRFWSTVIQTQFDCTIDYYLTTAVGTTTAAYYADFMSEVTSDM